MYNSAKNVPKIKGRFSGFRPSSPSRALRGAVTGRRLSGRKPVGVAQSMASSFPAFSNEEIAKSTSSTVKAAFMIVRIRARSFATMG